MITLTTNKMKVINKLHKDFRECKGQLRRKRYFSREKTEKSHFQVINEGDFK